VLTYNRRSMLIQLLQVKMNRMLLEGEVLSPCAKSVSAMLDNEASFEYVFDELQQFEQAEWSGKAKC
jgi:hypothetical protein